MIKLFVNILYNINDAQNAFVILAFSMCLRTQKLLFSSPHFSLLTPLKCALSKINDIGTQHFHIEADVNSMRRTSFEMLTRNFALSIFYFGFSIELEGLGCKKHFASGARFKRVYVDEIFEYRANIATER